MPGQTDEHVLQGRFVDAYGIDLTRERLNKVRDEPVAIGPLDAHAPVQYLRLDPEPFGNLFRQELRLCRFD